MTVSVGVAFEADRNDCVASRRFQRPIARCTKPNAGERNCFVLDLLPSSEAMNGARVGTLRDWISLRGAAGCATQFTAALSKDMVEAGEDVEAVARREVTEKLGVAVEGPLAALGEIRQAASKIVVAFAGAHNFDPASLVSNGQIDWPQRSERMLLVPEVDQTCLVAWTTRSVLVLKQSQAPLIEHLAAHAHQDVSSPNGLIFVA